MNEFEATLTICQSKYVNSSGNQIFYEAFEIFVDLIEQDDELEW